MTITRFPEVRAWRTKSVPCSSGCGRKLRRSRTFTQTQSPYNKNSQGRPATRQEIQAKLRVEGDAWVAAPETCRSCLSAAATAEQS